MSKNVEAELLKYLYDRTYVSEVDHSDDAFIDINSILNNVTLSANTTQAYVRKILVEFEKKKFICSIRDKNKGGIKNYAITDLGRSASKLEVSSVDSIVVKARGYLRDKLVNKGAKIINKPNYAEYLDQSEISSVDLLAIINDQLFIVLMQGITEDELSFNKKITSLSNRLKTSQYVFVVSDPFLFSKLSPKIKNIVMIKDIENYNL